MTSRPSIKSIELLAPARNLECGIEAIRHGADAVYIGAPRFGARAAAGNSVEDIAELVRFARPFGVKIYVTLNTLLYDDELPAAQALINDLDAIGIDALITQDPRIIPEAQESHESHLSTFNSQLSTTISSPLPLHSSTQMDNRTIDDVRARQAAGYTQTVLARELSLEDIRAIHDAVPEMPLEVFVHGALCVSYSGRCYASEYCFGRSANRGECAQFCRLPFDLIDADGRILEKQRHLLSLKDMNRAADLEALMDAGVTSFKIEGRLKDVSYVKNITAYYHQRIDAIIARRSSEYCRSSYGTSTISFTPNPFKSFNRGFTDYFLHGRTAEPIHQPLTPKSIGERIGEVASSHSSFFILHSSFPVAETATIVAGDGLCFFTSDGQLHGFRVNRVDEQGRIYPADPSVFKLLRPNTLLYRNHDAAFERQLSRPTADRRIPVRWLIEDTEDGFKLGLTPQPLSCREGSSHLSHSENYQLSTIRSAPCDASRLKNYKLSTINYQLSFPFPHELARTPQADNIRRQLMRLGDTPYTCTEADIEIRFSDNWFIPASVLGEWRRKVTDSPQVDSPPALPVREGANTLVQGYENNTMQSPRVQDNACDSGQVTAPSLIGRAGGESWAGGESAPLMTCRHCLRFALGYCTKSSPREKVPFREPLSLRLADGRTFPLRFDCARCEMQVLSGDVNTLTR